MTYITFVNHESVHQIVLLLTHWFLHQFYLILHQHLIYYVCIIYKLNNLKLKKCNQFGIQDILLKHILLFFNCLLVVMQLSLSLLTIIVQLLQYNTVTLFFLMWATMLCNCINQSSQVIPLNLPALSGWDSLMSSV